ncbi:MAG: hypothetical protein IPP90_19660 [Gemmatimonadaceae bacterium]|nr:hypothetical protein [Gemmatimonadaceae bacterium]
MKRPTMRVAFALLLLLHGSIHLLGFVKAFGFSDVAALRQSVTLLAGGLWLVAALLLSLSALLVATSSRWWWIPTGIGVLLSQALIVGAWGDARFGTVVNLLVLLPVLVVLADQRPGSLASRYHADVRALLDTAPTYERSHVTEADLAPLPPLVQGYLRRVGVVGWPHVWNFRASFSADFKMNQASPWMNASVEQYEFFNPSARLFFMTATRSGVPFDGYHRYVGNDAAFTVRVAGLVPMVDASGPVMTQSETVTLFNDMCILAPAALVDAPITWQTLDATHVRAEFRNAGYGIAAVLTFDAQGDLANFRSDDRHYFDGKTDKLLPWLTPVSSYRDFGGMRLAAVGEAQWLEDGKAWTYGRFVLRHIEYNVPSAARTRE